MADSIQISLFLPQKQEIWYTFLWNTFVTDTIADVIVHVKVSLISFLAQKVTHVCLV